MLIPIGFFNQEGPREGMEKVGCRLWVGGWGGGSWEVLLLPNSMTGWTNFPDTTQIAVYRSIFLNPLKLSHAHEYSKGQRYMIRFQGSVFNFYFSIPCSSYHLYADLLFMFLISHLWLARRNNSLCFNKIKAIPSLTIQSLSNIKLKHYKVKCFQI
jgi:hypothetical protein